MLTAMLVIGRGCSRASVRVFLAPRISAMHALAVDSADETLHAATDICVTSQDYREH
ncbi:hypothetical protein ACFLIM_48215 [Nonomuraea sp. M3C6]|uniref:Uncharacterized protein n=1 Tax=Nonomuraea marmarensis TaxID=3351344 RepID=A0ABW7AU62_9ACTN